MPPSGDWALGPDLSVQILNLIRRPALLLDGSGQIRGSNAAARLLLGPSCGGSQAKPLEALGSPPLSKAVGEALARPGSEVALGTTVAEQGGADVPVRCEGISFRSGEDATGAILIFTDLRPDREVSERAERATDLRFIGQTIAGSAHEIKNMLNGIEGGSALIHMGLERQRPGLVEKGWHMAERNITRVKNLAMDILSLARESPLHIAEARLDQAGLEAVSDMGDLARESGVELVAETEPDLPPFPFCRKAVVQCAVNLLSNAISACASQPEGRERKVLIRAARRPDGAFCLSVSDTGPGIPADVIPKILEGFRSTKGAGGTGLGLMVVQKILRAHGGRLEVQAAEGTGSTFTMVFPG